MRSRMERRVPTVLSQEAKLVFGHTVFGQRPVLRLVQAGAAAILFTGGNTSFSGFPFLTSFVAEDSFLPRWLSKRGHRLVFSNGIIVLTVLALALLFAVGANTNKLVPFYAIGVFTGFSMAGFGMVRYHLRQREPGWRRKLVINLTGGIYTALGRADLRGREVHRGRLAGGHRLPDRGVRVHPAEPAVPHRGPGPGEHRRAPRLRRAPAAAELHPPGRHRLRRRLRPGHPRRAAVRQEPAPHHGPGRALRHRQRAGRTAARRLAAGPQRVARLHRLPRPQADPVRRPTWSPRGESARHPGDRDPAPAQLLAAARPAAARPHRGQDRRRGRAGCRTPRPRSSRSTCRTGCTCCRNARPCETGRRPRR